ncbi:MAG TPA: DUF5666 domain-containing protein [Thermoanaerobaculia bacterium]|nr:DUF5666 domain-containing protein [Thermoanaerobaculia bacterium]
MKSFRPHFLVPALLLLLALPITADMRSTPAMEGPPSAAIEGTITSLNIPFVGGGPIVTLLDGLVSFDATGATVRFSNGTAGTTADLATGQRIVAFVEPTSAMPKAKSIVVLAQRTDVTLTGAVNAVDTTARTLTVLGFTARVTDKTVFGGPWDGAGQAGLEDVRVGDLVLVAATSDARTLVATRVMKLAPSVAPTTRIHGTVESIGIVSWTIVLRDGTKSVVKIDAETKVVGSPKAGDVVDVLARQLPDGSLVAILIAGFVPPPTVTMERYQGVVKAIGPTSWTIGPKAGDGPDRLFGVSAKTRFLGDPKVGDEVGVLAEKQSDGSYLATVIAKVTPGPATTPAVTFEGVLNRISAEGSMGGLGTWLVGDTKVMVSRLTIVLGGPKVGDKVRVEGLRTPDGTVMATRITKL